MDPTKLLRKPKEVHAALRTLPDKRVIALKPIKIYIPARFAERNLATTGTNIFILGIFAIVVDDRYYGNSLLNTMVPISPSQTNKVKYNGDIYFEYVFPPGSTVFKTTQLVKRDVLVYEIYEEFLSGGHIPWYMNYLDVGRLFDTALEFADANIGANKEVTQLIASIIARDPDDRTKYYRTAINSLEDLKKKKPVFIPLKSVQYAATNTTTKLGGSYFSQGVVSALIHPSTRTENIETLLRQ